jgi:parallel beta-helix repeat protein
MRARLDREVHSSAGLIENNTVHGVNGGSGIYLGDTSGCKIHDNVVREPANNGIDLAGNSDENLVYENVSSFNGRDGLRVLLS